MSLNLQLIIDGAILLIAVLTFFGADQRIKKLQFSMSKREIVGGLFAVAGLIYLVYISGKISELSPASASAPSPTPLISPTPSFPATNIMFTAGYAGGPGLPSGRLGFSPNKVFALNVGVQNLGPQLARNVCWSEKMRFLPFPALSGAEDQIYDEYRKSTPDTECEDLQTGQTAFATIGKKLSAQETSDLIHLHTAMYITGHASFQDVNGTHEIEVCEWVIHDLPLTMALCKHHNRVI